MSVTYGTHRENRYLCCTRTVCCRVFSHVIQGVSSETQGTTVPNGNLKRYRPVCNIDGGSTMAYKGMETFYIMRETPRSNALWRSRTDKRRRCIQFTWHPIRVLLLASKYSALIDFFLEGTRVSFYRVQRYRWTFSFLNALWLGRF